MSQENEEIVRRALSALDRRDVEAYLELASPEIELINPASPLEGPTTGHDGVRRFFSEIEAYAETSAFQVEEIRTVNSQVLAYFTLTALGSLSGAEIGVRLAGVYEVEDGKVRRVRIFTDRTEALEAAGLSE
jgi:ketosteroid isomerase-like protein